MTAKPEQAKAQTIEIKVERTIPASIEEAYDAWLNPEIPGTPWSENDKLIFNPKVDGLFYWLIRGNSHFGRFTELQRPHRIQHTWMSNSTLGQESTVTLTFVKKGDDTLMTLEHTNLPDDQKARGHEKGWNYFLGKLADGFGSRQAKK